MFDLLAIGSGPAAWSCALTARKRGLRCAVISAQAGTGWLHKAGQVDNYPGMPGVSGREMLEVFQRQAEAVGTEVIHGVARQIQPAGSAYMTLVGNDIVESRAVALCMGAARPKLLPGEEELLGQGVSWCGTCDGMFFRGKDVAVLSSWHGGVEEADFLSQLCRRVDYYVLGKHDIPGHIAVRPGTPKALAREEGRVTVTTTEGSAAYDGVFVFRPAVSPGAMLPGLAMNGAFITVDRRMATNLPRVYAAGDCTGMPLQIAKAVGEGNVAAISAAEDLSKE